MKTHRPDNICPACGRATSVFDLKGNLVGQDHRAQFRDVTAEAMPGSNGGLVYRLRREWTCRYTRGEVH